MKRWLTGQGSTVPPLFWVVAAMFAGTGAGAAGPDDWPRWRGPGDNGSVVSGDYPVKFDATTNLCWKVVLPGTGCSTPIVWGQSIFLTSPAQGQDAVLAWDRSGRPLWQIRLGPERQGKNSNGSGSNPSPATDGRDLFVCFKSGLLVALDLNGQLRWKTNLLERFGPDTLFWDYGSSPVLTERDVVVALMRHGSSWVAAFDKRTGAVHWQVARDYNTPVEGDHSYTSPLVIRHQDQEAILVWGAMHLTAHAAIDGKVLWFCGGFNPQATAYWPAVASPVIAGDIVVVPYGRGARLHGIKLGGAGDVTATNRVWLRENIGAFVPTPAEYQGRVYVLRDRGEIECVDPATGRSLWSGMLPKESTSYYASPLVAAGKLYAAREDGVVFVARIEGKFEVLARNDLGERLIASPVPLGNRLLFRGAEHLFCVGAP